MKSKESIEREHAVADAQATRRSSKRRAFFGERRSKEDSLMYREPVFSEEAALSLKIKERFHLPSRIVQFRPSWPNSVAIFSKFTPVTDRGNLRMRVVGTAPYICIVCSMIVINKNSLMLTALACYNGPVIDAFDIETGQLVYSSPAHDRPVHCISLIDVRTKSLPIFASCCHGGTINVLELQTGNILTKVRSPRTGPCYG